MTLDVRAPIGEPSAEPALAPGVEGPATATSFASNARALGGADVLRLQGGAGNAAVARMLQERRIARTAETDVAEEPVGRPAPEEADAEEEHDEEGGGEDEDAVPEGLPEWVDPPDAGAGSDEAADEDGEGGAPFPDDPPQTGPAEEMRVEGETDGPEVQEQDARVARALARRPAPPEAGYEKPSTRAGGGSGAAPGGPTKGPPRGGSRVGIVSIDRGEPAKLRKGPSTKSKVVRALPFNTRVFITGKRGEWLYVTTAQGDFGYIYDKLVKQNLPEPGARLYRVKAGDSAIAIAGANYRRYVKPGEDLRFFVNVLEYVNRGPGDRGIYQPDPGNRKTGAWKDVKVRSDFLIWVPGGEFAKTLKGVVRSGSLTGGAWAKARGIVKTIEDFAIGGAAFVAGLLDGAFSAVKDLLTGLGSLAASLWKVIKSLLTGRILGDARRLWEALRKLDPKDIAEDWIRNFVRNWTAKDVWTRWKFRGYVAGYAVAEVAMILLTSGGSLAVKLAAKMGKLGSRLTGLVRGFNAKLSKTAATATKSRLLGRQLNRLGLSRRYILLLRPAEREAAQHALNRWNLAGDGRSQGVVHIVDYASGAAGGQKTGRLADLERYNQIGPFSLKDRRLIPVVTEALDDLTRHPDVFASRDGDPHVYWIPRHNLPPEKAARPAKGDRGTLILKSNGRYSTFHAAEYRRYLKLAGR